MDFSDITQQAWDAFTETDRYRDMMATLEAGQSIGDTFGIMGGICQSFMNSPFAQGLKKTFNDEAAASSDQISIGGYTASWSQGSWNVDKAPLTISTRIREPKGKEPDREVLRGAFRSAAALDALKSACSADLEAVGAIPTWGESLQSIRQDKTNAVRVAKMMFLKIGSSI